MFRLMGIKAIDVKSIVLPESDARVPCSKVRSRIWKKLAVQSLFEVGKAGSPGDVNASDGMCVGAQLDAVGPSVCQGKV